MAKCNCLKKKLHPIKMPVKEKIIPDEIFGIKAITPAPEMEGILDWLKFTRIHKYWAFFSHLSYEALITLNDENLDLYLRELGARQSFMVGTRKKILKSIEELRNRTQQLRDLDPFDVEFSCYVISTILKTPICDYIKEVDGTYITGLLKEKITQVVDAARKRGEWSIFIKAMLEEYVEHKSIPDFDKMCAKQWLKYIQFDFLPTPDLSLGYDQRAKEKPSIMMLAKLANAKKQDYNNNYFN
ncbi:uncharacterized protein LOC112127950 [Cimex lectularius]|uniref:SAM domain-containing protein n=1 Tax=Cimex lectularius TaxID=79782 RepID=A0A8I6SN48_CIMLE|nr:uncharacterized protein LOC112127950 [Cimex lectularius]